MKVRTRYEAPEETNIPGIIYLPSVPIVDTEVFEPCRLFDNLYFIGTRFIGTLVVTTREGLVLIDSMNCRRDVEEIIYPGLAKLGLNGEKILAVIITHGHFDHFGGAAAIQQRSGCQVVMSRRDEVFMQEPDNQVPEQFARDGVEYPQVTSHVEDGTELVFGGTGFRFSFTPGHTPGGISLVLPVYDQGEKHMVSIWGGINPPGDKSACRTYIDSAVHFQKFSREAGCDVEFSLHPFVDYSLEKMEKIRCRKKGAGHPLVIGPDGVSLFMEIVKVNAKQKLDTLL